MGPGEFDEAARMRARMFEDGNRIVFERPVDAPSRAWWIDTFYDPFALTPEGMGDLLTKSVSDTKVVRYRHIDGAREEFALRVEGRFSDGGDLWFVERTLNLAGGLFNADAMFIPAGERQAGRGRLLMRDLIAASQLLGINRIEIEAERIGSYAWLRMGFLPDRGSWITLQAEALRFVAMHAGTLGARAEALRRQIAAGGPEMARGLAGIDDPVPSAELFQTDGSPILVPFGRALFIERGLRWAGAFRFDKTSLTVANEYLGSIEDDG